MSVVTADRAAVAVEQLEQSWRETWLLDVRCALLGAVVVGAAAYVAPRAALVRHGQGVVVLGVLLAIALAVRSWRGIAAEPRAIPMRAADLSIAGGLGCAAAFLAWQLPAVFGPDAEAWGAGMGVVAPLVGGAIAVLFGSRMLYRLRGAVTALALLSPALLRPAYVLLDTATKFAARAVVEIASSIDSSLLAPNGSAAAAGDLLAQRLTKAGAFETAAVMLLLGWRMTTGRRIARTAWSVFVVVVCFASALRDAVPAACVAAVLATPAIRLRFPAREHQPLVDGFIVEQSPERWRDFAKQRRRWYLGLWKVRLYSPAPTGARVALMAFLVSWMLSAVGAIYTIVNLSTGLGTPAVPSILGAAVLSWYLSAYWVGLRVNLAAMPPEVRPGRAYRALLYAMQFLLFPLFGIAEAAAMVLAAFWPERGFHVVRKSGVGNAATQELSPAG